jgi:hypothetical protein
MKPGAIIFVPDFYNLSVVLRHVLKGIYLTITGLPRHIAFLKMTIGSMNNNAHSFTGGL